MKKIPKKPEFRFLILLITCWMSFEFDTASASTVASNDSSEPRTLRVGLRQDAKPFSYPHEDLVDVSILRQHKGFMVAVCRRVLKKMMESPQYADLEIVSVTVQAGTRFDDLSSGKVDLLCGPDSITTERLDKYYISHPMFMSGMTYSYLNPTSRNFPHSEYCGHILGVVNGTTAEATGITQMGKEGVLLRFDSAVDLNLALDAERYQLLLDKAENKRPQWNKSYSLAAEFVHSIPGKEMLRMINNTTMETGENAKYVTYINCIYKSTNQQQYIQDKVTGYIHDESVNAAVQKEISKKIITQECPKGFTQGLPVRKYKDHDAGIKDFCDGKVLYYLGDYDILRAKVDEHANCEVEFNRFTTNKEVYGAFFRSGNVSEIPSKLCNPPRAENYAAEITDSDFSSKSDSATLYADFNQALLRMMQADVDILGEVYKSEFKGKAMSTDLREFFDSFRVAADLGQPGE